MRRRPCRPGIAELNPEQSPSCLLVGVGLSGDAIDESKLDELDLLAQSAGIEPAGRLVCRRSRPDAAYFVGSGKVDEIARWIEANPVDAVVFDNPLGPIQQRNLNRRLDLPVVDRTELILDIFSRRAASREGKLQVELAQLEHLSARLVRGWTHLERQRGGIGARGGPGEKQVELDRRMLGQRVKRLRAELQKLRKQRANRRRARDRSGVFKISLVGYTNAGKSTLFNRLTGAGTMAADQLFATLDTLSRKHYIEGVGEVMLSDTVGFVRELPHSLIEAFKATLEETAQADLLLHVIDASSPDRHEQVSQVESVLAEIDAGDVPTLRVYNKADRIEPPLQPASVSPADMAESAVKTNACDSMQPVFVSSLTGVGVAELTRRIATLIEQIRVPGGQQGFRHPVERDPRGIHLPENPETPDISGDLLQDGSHDPAGSGSS